MSSDTNVFTIEVSHGYALRQCLIEVLNKLQMTSAPFYFTRDGMYIVSVKTTDDDTRKIISVIDISDENILKYKINREYISNPDKGVHVRQIVVSSNSGINTILKNVSTSFSFKMYENINDGNVYIESKGPSSAPQISKVDTTDVVDKSGKSLDIFSDVENDKLRLEFSDFCTNMKAVKRGDVKDVTFKIYKGGMIVEARNSDGVLVNTTGFGNKTRRGMIEEDTEGDEFFTTKVGITALKVLEKLNTCAKNSIVKIYCDTDGAFFIRHNIGDFGVHNLYFIDETCKK